jgi:hypothetical protein
MPWGVQSLQAAWWVPSGLSTSAGDIYQALMGTAAASVQTNPSQRVESAVGADAQRVFRVQLQPGRLDVFQTPLPHLGSSIFPLFSDLRLTMQDFQQRLVAATRIAGNVLRLALLVTISEPAPGWDQATSALLSKLGITLPFQGGQELIFQINKRKELSSITGQEINRIMKWVAENVQQVSVGTGGAPTIDSVFLSTLSVDINTITQSSRTFTPAEQNHIFQEMSIEAERLCQTNALSALA